MSEYIYARVDRVIAACNIALGRIQDARHAEMMKYAERAWRRSQPGRLRRLLGAKETPREAFVEAYVRDFEWPLGMPYGGQATRLRVLLTVARTAQVEASGGPLMSLSRKDCTDLNGSWPPLPEGDSA
jgi:hypothetical protein